VHKNNQNSQKSPPVFTVHQHGIVRQTQYWLSYRQHVDLFVMRWSCYITRSSSTAEKQRVSYTSF